MVLWLSSGWNFKITNTSLFPQNIYEFLTPQPLLVGCLKLKELDFSTKKATGGMYMALWKGIYGGTPCWNKDDEGTVKWFICFWLFSIVFALLEKAPRIYWLVKAVWKWFIATRNNRSKGEIRVATLFPLWSFSSSTCIKPFHSQEWPLTEI